MTMMRDVTDDDDNKNIIIEEKGKECIFVFKKSWTERGSWDES